MKTKVTKKNIKDQKIPVYAIAYCDAQYLLSQEAPFAYSAGIYGWDCDYYCCSMGIISTGYRPIGHIVPHKIVHKYEDQAKRLYDYYCDAGVLKHLLMDSINKMILEVENGKKCKS